MKKLLLIAVAFLGVIFSVNAQTGTCTISGGNGATVNVTVVDWSDDGTVELSIDSDSEYHVNVIFTLSYTVDDGIGPNRTSQQFSTTAKPNQSNSKIVRIRLSALDKKLRNVIAVNVEGARCQK